MSPIVLILTLLLAVGLNVVIGTVVGMLIDDDELRVLAYVNRCPFGFTVGVSLWPIWLLMILRDRRAP